MSRLRGADEEARERLAVRTAERRLEQAVRVRASAADALDRAKRALDAYAGDGPDSASALAAHARAEELLAVHRAAAGPSPEADGGGTADEAQGTDAPGAADGGVDAGAPPGRGMEVIGDPALARDLVLEMEIPDLTPDHLAETVLNAFPDDGEHGRGAAATGRDPRPAAARRRRGRRNAAGRRSRQPRRVAAVNRPRVPFRPLPRALAASLAFAAVAAAAAAMFAAGLLGDARAVTAAVVLGGGGGCLAVLLLREEWL